MLERQLMVFSRPYRRAYASVAFVCRRRLWRMYCGQTVRPRAKVTIESL